jgi:hypothetical protein
MPDFSGFQPFSHFFQIPGERAEGGRFDLGHHPQMITIC